MEYINPSENGYTSTPFPTYCGNNGVLYGSRVISFNGPVNEKQLEPPYTQSELCKTNYSYSNSYGNVRYSAQRFGDRIYVVGREYGLVEQYDVVHNEMKRLPGLPYSVIDAATVAYKDCLVVIGGRDKYGTALNKVYMYNIHTLESKPLPSMREARLSCAAVLMGDVIVVMGGGTQCEPLKLDYNYQRGYEAMTPLKTVEYYVIGDSEWQELPSMSYVKQNASACVYI